MERKLLELRNEEFGGQDIRNVVHMDLEITKIIGTMAFHECCYCFIIVVCEKLHESSKLSAFIDLAVPAITLLQKNRILDYWIRLKLSAILAWLIIIFF